MFDENYLDKDPHALQVLSAPSDNRGAFNFNILNIYIIYGRWKKIKNKYTGKKGIKEENGIS